MMSQSNAVDNFLAENKNLAAMMIFIDPKDLVKDCLSIKTFWLYSWEL